jgi:hypothetical protein
MAFTSPAPFLPAALTNPGDPMTKRTLLISYSIATIVAGVALLGSPARADASGCVAKTFCRVQEKCYSGWSSTGEPVTWCECLYTCG